MESVTKLTCDSDVAFLELLVDHEQWIFLVCVLFLIPGGRVRGNQAKNTVMNYINTSGKQRFHATVKKRQERDRKRELLVKFCYKMGAKLKSKKQTNEKQNKKQAKITNTHTYIYILPLHSDRAK